MKYIGLLAFLVALNWTWSLAIDEKNISLETHTIIQEQIVDLITESVAAKRPNSIEVKFERIWTEPINDDRIKASYKYQILQKIEGGFQDSETISGYAMLKRLDEDIWTIDKVFASNAEISFGTGVVIRPNSN